MKNSMQQVPTAIPKVIRRTGGANSLELEKESFERLQVWTRNDTLLIIKKLKLWPQRRFVNGRIIVMWGYWVSIRVIALWFISYLAFIMVMICSVNHTVDVMFQSSLYVSVVSGDINESTVLQKSYWNVAQWAKWPVGLWLLGSLGSVRLSIHPPIQPGRRQPSCVMMAVLLWSVEPRSVMVMKMMVGRVRTYWFSDKDHAIFVVCDDKHCLCAPR